MLSRKSVIYANCFHNKAIFSIDELNFIAKIMNKRDSKSSDTAHDYRKHHRAHRPEMNANDWETALWQNRISSETVCVYECVCRCMSLERDLPTTVATSSNSVCAVRFGF